MKKFICIILAVVMIITIIPMNICADEKSDGICGDNLKWSFDGNGTIIISGTGKMYDYGTTNDNSSPWSNIGDITTIIIEEGVTHIGEFAFIDYDNIEKIMLPNSILYIDFTSFFYCYGEPQIYYAGNEKEWSAVSQAGLSTFKTDDQIIYGKNPANDNSWTLSTPSQWAEFEVNSAIQNGLVTDVVKQNYQAYITREQFCELVMKLYKALNNDADITISKNTFVDTANESVLQAYELGIVNGTSDIRFSPNELITREEICVMISRTIKALYPNTDLNSYQNRTFEDGEKISSWAMPFLLFAYDKNIIQGVDSDRIEPLGNTTCEQAILLINRVYENRSTFIVAETLGAKSVEDLDKQTPLLKYVYTSADGVIEETYLVYFDAEKERNNVLRKLSSDYSGIVVEGENGVSVGSELLLFASTHRNGKHIKYPEYDWDNIIWRVENPDIIQYSWQDGVIDGMLAGFRALKSGRTIIYAVDGETGIETAFVINVNYDRTVLLDEEHTVTKDEMYNIPYAIKQGDEYINDIAISWTIENTSKDQTIISIFSEMITSSQNTLTIKCVNTGECDLVMYENGIEIARTHITVKNQRQDFENATDKNDSNTQDNNVLTKKQKRALCEAQVADFRNTFLNTEVTEENRGDLLYLIETFITACKKDADLNTSLNTQAYNYNIQLIKLVVNSRELVDELERIDGSITDINNMISGGWEKVVTEALKDEAVNTVMRTWEKQADDAINDLIEGVLDSIGTNDAIWNRITELYLKENGFS